MIISPTVSYLKNSGGSSRRTDHKYDGIWTWPKIMSTYPPRKELPPLGALCLDYTDDIHRPPGDPLNELSYQFPVIHEMVKDATVWNVVKKDEYSDETLQNYIDACNRLQQRGAVGVITSCGFLAQVQNRLAAAVEIPVATSSLIQVPFVSMVIGPSKLIGVLTFDAEVLGKAHFKGLGISEELQSRIVVKGCPVGGVLRGMIIEGDPYVHDDLENEMVGIAKELVGENPSIGAIVLECTQMPPFARAVQKATGLPVYDAITMIDWFYSGLVSRIIPEDGRKQDGLRRRRRSAKELK
ncbi:hypothetical protein KL919_003520 [Ogataea angusta]|uniref:Aspartate/glutamate racemase family protein n=1 Tax=Pichia angusta TaxID=870730 RepID=A0AAN6DE40_PICAN|nr:uncharacterized protein KL928_003685 [Ogataea angusta]KAG7817786.1 hypothetical protein KL928_003685 [Ogataea angusta]KAG7858262.1 hypothetical protein KL919_003520 [Ogataea angusta]